MPHAVFFCGTSELGPIEALSTRERPLLVSLEPCLNRNSDAFSGIR